MIREEIRVRLEKAFSKVAYLNARAMDPEDFQQEMWVELGQWVAKHGEEGIIPSGKHQGKKLMEQTPVFIAYRMAGRAKKANWHINRRNRAESSIDEVLEGASEGAEFSTMLAQSRGESIKTLVLWAYRERGLLTPEVEKALSGLYRESGQVEAAPLVEGPVNYHIAQGDSYEMALCKRLAALTGAEALDVLILLESKEGRYYEALRAVLEYGGASKAELMKAGISCKFFSKAKKELASIYD